MTGPLGHPVAERERGARVVEHPEDAVWLEVQGGPLEQLLPLVVVFQQLLVADAAPVGQEEADRHEDRDPVRLAERAGVFEAGRPLRQQLLRGLVGVCLRRERRRDVAGHLASTPVQFLARFTASVAVDP